MLPWVSPVLPGVFPRFSFFSGDISAGPLDFVPAEPLPPLNGPAHPGEKILHPQLPRFWTASIALASA